MDISTLPSYREVIELLDTYTNLERVAPRADGLSGGSERMAALMGRLGSPHATIPAVHVAGTKGKGSVCHLVSAALVAAGFRTGLYTSPHVENLRERIMVNGRPIGEQRFVESCMTVLKEAEEMRKNGVPPSYFEILTATALVAFAGVKVDAMVLETGLGGRLDATNLADLRLVAAGITAISRDHQEILGDSLEAIAGEKAAIIRRGVPAVSAPQQDAAMRVINQRAEEQRAPLFTVGKDIMVSFRRRPTLDRPNIGQKLDFETWRNVYPDINVTLLGEHQADNAALALGLTDLFLEYMDREPLDSLVLKRAWHTLIIPARMEVVSDKPWLIVDGAHNPASAWAAAETVRECFSVKHHTLIFGVSSDKDWRTMLRILVPLFKQVVFSPFNSPRSVDPAELAAFVEDEFPEVKTATAVDAANALKQARSATPSSGLILATGSMYLAGEMRVLMRRLK